ncbi:MAG: hypothetical protein OIF32_10235, partial [Campylobacterales bacterium]|nr:hypothetical protein [Campylobacterales bacterium]
VKENSTPKTTEWNHRRLASQVLSQAGTMMLKGHITRDDFFEIIPEAGRILAVLIPIEEEIRLKYSEGSKIADWDIPFGKNNLENLLIAYEEWFKKKHKEVTEQKSRFLKPE